MSPTAYRTNNIYELKIPDKWIKAIKNVDWIKKSYDAFKKIILFNEFPIIDETQPFVSKDLLEHGERILTNFKNLFDRYCKIIDNKTELSAEDMFLIICLSQLHDLSLTINTHHNIIVPLNQCFLLQKETILRYLDQNFLIIFTDNSSSDVDLENLIAFKERLLKCLSLIYWSSQGDIQNHNNIREQRNVTSETFKENDSTLLFLFDIARLCTYDKEGVKLWEKGRLAYTEREYCYINSMRFIKELNVEFTKNDNLNLVFNINFEKNCDSNIKEIVSLFFNTRIRKTIAIHGMNINFHIKDETNQTNIESQKIKLITEAKKILLLDYPMKYKHRLFYSYIQKYEEAINKDTNTKLFIELQKDFLELFIKLKTTRKVDNLIRPFYNVIMEIEKTLDNGKSDQYKDLLIGELISRINNRISGQFTTAIVVNNKNKKENQEKIEIRTKSILTLIAVAARTIFMTSLIKNKNTTEDHIKLFQTLFLTNLIELTRIIHNVNDEKYNQLKTVLKNNLELIIKKICQYWMPEGVTKIGDYLSETTLAEEVKNLFSFLFKKGEQEKPTNKHAEILKKINVSYSNFSVKYQKTFEKLEGYMSDGNNNILEELKSYLKDLENVDKFVEDIIGTKIKFDEELKLFFKARIINEIARYIDLKIIKHLRNVEGTGLKPAHEILKPAHEILNYVSDFEKSSYNSNKTCVFFSPEKQKVYLKKILINAMLINNTIAKKNESYIEKEIKVLHSNLRDLMKNIMARDINSPIIFETTLVNDVISTLKIIILRFDFVKLKEETKNLVEGNEKLNKKYENVSEKMLKIINEKLYLILLRFTHCLQRVFYSRFQYSLFVANSLISDIRSFSNKQNMITKNIKLFITILWILIKLSYEPIKRTNRDNYIKMLNNFIKQFSNSSNNISNGIFCFDQSAKDRFPGRLCDEILKNKNLDEFNRKITHDITLLYYIIKAELSSIYGESANYPKIYMENKENLINNREKEIETLISHENAQQSFLRALRRIKFDTNYYLKEILHDFVLRSYYNQKAWYCLKRAFFTNKIAPYSKSYNETPRDIITDDRTDEINLSNEGEQISNILSMEKSIIENYFERIRLFEQAATYFRFSACYADSAWSRFSEKCWGRRYLCKGLEKVYTLGSFMLKHPKDNMNEYQNINEEELKIALEESKEQLLYARWYFANTFSFDNFFVELTKVFETIGTLNYSLVYEFFYGKSTKNGVSEISDKINDVEEIIKNFCGTYDKTNDKIITEYITSFKNLLKYLESLKKVVDYTLCFNESSPDVNKSLEVKSLEVDKAWRFLWKNYKNVSFILSPIVFYLLKITKILLNFKRLMYTKNCFTNLKDIERRVSFIINQNKDLIESINKNLHDGGEKLSENSLLKIIINLKSKYEETYRKILDTKIFTSNEMEDSNRKILDTKIFTSNEMEDSSENDQSILYTTYSRGLESINKILCEIGQNTNDLIKIFKIINELSEVENQKEIKYIGMYNILAAHGLLEGVYKNLPKNMSQNNDFPKILNSQNEGNGIDNLFSMLLRIKRKTNITLFLGSGASIPIPMVSNLNAYIKDWLLIKNFVKNIELDDEKKVGLLSNIWNNWLSYSYKLYNKSHGLNSDKPSSIHTQINIKNQILDTIKHQLTINDKIEKYSDTFFSAWDKIINNQRFSCKKIEIMKDDIEKTDLLSKLEKYSNPKITIEHLLTFNRILKIIKLYKGNEVMYQRLFTNFLFDLEDNISFTNIDNISFTNIESLSKTLDCLITDTMMMFLFCNPQEGHSSISEFINKLCIEHGTCVNINCITTNYDLGLESALLNRKENGNTGDSSVTFIYYNKDRGNQYCKEKNEIEILKIHGSVNFVKCPKCNQIMILDTERIKQLKSEYIKNQKGREFMPKCSNDECKNPTEFFIIAPTSIKEITEPFLFGLSNKVQHTIEESDIVIVIGYSFSPADINILRIFQISIQNATEKNKLPIYIIANKSKKAYDNFKKYIFEDNKKINQFEKFIQFFEVPTEELKNKLFNLFTQTKT